VKVTVPPGLIEVGFADRVIVYAGVPPVAFMKTVTVVANGPAAKAGVASVIESVSAYTPESLYWKEGLDIVWVGVASVIGAEASVQKALLPTPGQNLCDPVYPGVPPSHQLVIV
jgi:hypothetical protein